MSKFIQLPQAGEALPILIHLKTVRHVEYNERRITVQVEQEGHYHTRQSCPLPAKQAIALYWYLHALLNPEPLELWLN